MDTKRFIDETTAKERIGSAVLVSEREDEVYVAVGAEEFGRMCLALHHRLHSPVMMYFAVDERREHQSYGLYCAFLSAEHKKWFFVRMTIPEENPRFSSISKEIYSASLFEREMKEMFGLEPEGHPDLRRLHLHDEVWPEGFYPLKKDFGSPEDTGRTKREYRFKRVEGEGLFEVPVGPVHAGIIGPGHFRFSVAGEPIIHLEARLGFTHRGVEKLFEGRSLSEAIKLSESIAGDSAFSYSMAFCQGIEKISGLRVPERARRLRAVFLELERMVNHAADIGGIALDVGFTFPSAYASILKESLLRLNEKVSGNRYLKGINQAGGVGKDLNQGQAGLLSDSLSEILEDFRELKGMLLGSVSFMDRVDKTGVLNRKTASDLGVVGLAGRASGIGLDLRKVFPGPYQALSLNVVKQEEGDVLARLKVRLHEFEESARLIKALLQRLGPEEVISSGRRSMQEGFGLGYVEGWRGPVLCWIKTDRSGAIDRCKIVDPSFRNWNGLCFAAPGNIIPDFPLCNKSFNLSYSGNDL